MPHNFQVGNRVRCIEAGRNPARNEQINYGDIYEVTQAGADFIRINNLRTMWAPRRFELVNDAVRVPIPDPQPQPLVPRETSVKYVVIDEDHRWYVYSNERDARARKRQLEDDGDVAVIACKKLTVTVNI